MRIAEQSRVHLRIALPLCLSQLGQQLMSLVDAAMVGHFDRVALAGFGVANILLFAISFLGVGVILGLDSLVPQALGRNDPAEARRLYHSGLVLAAIIGVLLTGVALLAPPLLEPMGVSPEVAEQANLYMYGRLPAIAPFLLFTASASYLQAVGLGRALVIATLVGNLINLLADWVLVFGHLGFPALGGLGASISTCIVTIVMSLTLLQCAHRHPAEGLQVGLGKTYKASKALTLKILCLGTPIGLQLLAEVGIFAFVGVLAGGLGALAGSAHQLALTIASVPFSIALGMGSAAAIQVGSAVGAGDHVQARRAGIVAVAWGSGIMLCFGVCFVTFPSSIASLFTSDPEIIEAVAPLLAVAAIFQFSDATQAILAGALRGAGDTKASFLANFIGHYGVGLWIALSLGRATSMGALGLWWGLAAGLSLTAILLAARFWHLTSKSIPHCL